MTTRIWMTLALAVLGGCATVYDGKYNYEQGWRIGEVWKIGTGTARFPIAGVDCRATASQADLAGSRYAYIQFVFDPMGGKYFYHGPKQRHAIVAIPEGINLQESERVYVNVRDCDQAIVRLSHTRPQT